MFDNVRVLKPILRCISVSGQLRENDKVGVLRFRGLDSSNNFGSVPGNITIGGIDLGYCYPHRKSLDVGLQ